ncbi:unnamed protein product, partial [Staurois parvus]
YCESCDWTQLVTWYKAVVNSLVPCYFCDHSQISHVVSNDVRRDILFTTVPVITDWPISDHMNQDLTQRSRRTIGVPLCPSGHSRYWIVVLRTQAENVDAVYERQPTPALLLFSCLCTWAGQKWL